MKLQIKHLSFSYRNDSRKAVNDISYTFHSGVYGLLGPNGAGKTTLMNLLTCNLKPGSGSILWRGNDIYSLGGDYRKNLGFMPQTQGLYDDFTGERFMWYMAGVKGIPHRKAAQQIDELLSVVHLEEERFRKIRSYSGGMKQRLLLAQSLLSDPKILVLDEPTAGLDPRERIRIRNYISGISGDRIVLLATHIVSDVESIAEKILFMKEGRLILTGTPEEVLGKLDGRVFEVLLKEGGTEEEEITRAKGILVSNVHRTARGTIYRIICGGVSGEGTYQMVPPNLEDIYLYLMRD